MNRKHETDTQQILSSLIDGNPERATRLMSGLPFEVREKMLRASYQLAHISRQMIPVERVNEIEKEFAPKQEEAAAVSGGE